MSHWKTKIFEYGEKENRLHHILDVNNGLNCNCHCPACGEKLVAVNNIKAANLRPYFRHYSKDCDYKHYKETVVHLLSKEIIEKKGYIILPKITYYLNDDYSSYLTDITSKKYKEHSLPPFIDKKISTYKLKFDKIIIEKNTNKIKPDIQIFINNKPLIIEIAYSHFIDEKKLKTIKTEKLNCIEIILSHLNKNSSEKNIELEIYHNVIQNISWINNEKNKAELKQKLNEAIEIRDVCWGNSKELKAYANLNKIFNCPKVDTEYVSVKDDCKYCIYCCGVTENFNPKYMQFKIEEEYLESINADTSDLYEKYEDKTFYKSGFVNCAYNLRFELEDKLKKFNRS